jgi:hypothetical protein
MRRMDGLAPTADRHADRMADRSRLVTRAGGGMLLWGRLSVYDSK